MPKLESRARPVSNLLINGGMDFFQRTGGASIDLGTSSGGTPAGGDGKYENVPDRWFALINTGGINTPYTSRVVGDASGSYYSQFALNYATAISLSGLGGVAQIVEASNVFPLRGRTVRFQCRAATDVAAKPLRCAIIATTSTVAAVDTFTSTTRDVVTNWASTTYTQNNFFKSNANGYYVVGTGNVTPSGTITAYSDLSCTGTVPVDAQNLICLVFIETALGDSKNFRLTQAGLYDGIEARDWLPRPIGQELALCQRYFEKSFGLDTRPNTNVGTAGEEASSWLGVQTVGASTSAALGSALRFVVAKRIIPTCVIFHPTAGSNQIRNITFGADYTVSAAVAARYGIYFTATSPAGSAKGDLAYCHWTADSEL